MCPPCNYWFNAPTASPLDANTNFNKMQIVAFVGAALLLVGLFMPLVGVPFFSVNYYTLTQFSSLAGLGFFLLLVCCVTSVLLAATRRCSLLRWPGLAALLLLAFTFYTISSKISEARTHVEKNMASVQGAQNAQLKQMGTAFMSMIQMQWGWGVLGIGAALIIIAGMMKDE
jgi:hypothetical protein